jgi:DNA-binding NtrC family response regulator
LRIPPLRGRPDDIAFLAQRFLEKIQRQTGLTRTLSNETLQMLETYDWPDNVRELEHTITRAWSQSSGSELEPIHMPQKLVRFHRNVKQRLLSNSFMNEDADEAPSKHSVIPIAKVEERAILDAIRETNGNKLMAAELLGIGKTTLYRKLKEYGFADELNYTVALLSSKASHSDATDARPVMVCA